MRTKKDLKRLNSLIEKRNRNIFSGIQVGWKQRKTVVYSIYKVSEGGMGQRQAIEILKDSGIKAKPATSIYVGQTAVLVTGGTRIQQRASRILYGR